MNALYIFYTFEGYGMIGSKYIQHDYHQPLNMLMLAYN